MHMFTQRWLHLFASSVSCRRCDPAHEESATSVYFRLNKFFIIIHCQFFAEIPMIICKTNALKKVQSFFLDKKCMKQTTPCLLAKKKSTTGRAWVYRQRSCDAPKTGSYLIKHSSMRRRSWVYRHRSCDSAHNHHYSPCHTDCSASGSNEKKFPPSARRNDS